MLRTASQRRKLCAGCPLARAADMLGDSVSLILIRDLLIGPKRFGELSDSLKGVSTRTLTLKLEKLKAGGFLRHTNASYELTAKGLALAPVVESLRRYGEAYL